jgi:hypothetical protein
MNSEEILNSQEDSFSKNKNNKSEYLILPEKFHSSIKKKRKILSDVNSPDKSYLSPRLMNKEATIQNLKLSLSMLNS